MSVAVIACPRCDAWGWSFVETVVKPCGTCKGRGALRVPDPETLEVLPPVPREEPKEGATA